MELHPSQYQLSFQYDHLFIYGYFCVVVPKILKDKTNHLIFKSQNVMMSSV